MLYFKQLDSIRAIAVSLVIICHWVPANYVLDDDDLGQIGALGVNIFFVLSGFLITRILIDYKSQIISSNLKKSAALKVFYFRRALRIFPIYYLYMLLLPVLFTIPSSELFHSLTYTINFYFFEAKYWSPYTTHLWSLAVEEQFYLFWPLFVLFINKRYLLHVIFSFIAIGLSTQLLVTDHEFGYLPTYTCLDAFGIGALIAWTFVYKFDLFSKTYSTLTSLALACILLTLLGFQYSDLRFILPQRTVHSLIAAWLIITITFSEKFPWLKASFIVENKFLIFIGKISYGIYLYHLIIPDITYQAHKRFDAFLPNFLTNPNCYIRTLENLIVLIVVSWISWILIEKPILQHKNTITAKCN